MQKIAIIGTSVGQLKLYQTAKNLGYYTIGFSWDHGVVPDDLISTFYQISIMEMDKIADICAKENINGIVSNGSDLTATVVTYIADKLHLNGNSYDNFIKTQNKFYTRTLTNTISGLNPVRAKMVKSIADMFFPCVVKPCIGHSKRGIAFAHDIQSAPRALEYAQNTNNEIFIEEFISGKEFSVESISFNGEHRVVQITEKISSGDPHFIEIGHIQPADIPNDLKIKIHNTIPKILNSIKFRNGATHTEIKINMQTHDIFLIEVNMRGGGDEISNTLVNLSTDFDYIKAMISVALGNFTFPNAINNTNSVGICFLCKQTQDAFQRIIRNKKIIEKKIFSDNIQESTTNYDRQGYVIYKN